MTLTSWNVPLIRHDKRAIKILMETHWSPGGWRPDRSEHPEAHYARKAGYLYDEMRLGHDDAVDRAISIGATLTPKEVGSAFLASLSTRRLELRSALGSYALASLLPTHPFRGEFACEVCCAYESDRAEDLGTFNFERYKWGGVRHLYPAYMWFDLALFSKTERLEPTDTDRDIFGRILAAVVATPPSGRPGDLAKALGGDFPSNNWERRTLLQILSYAGILEPDDRPVFGRGWVDCRDREEPRESKNDWPYPFLWWRGRHGINHSRLRHFFPDLGITVG